DDRVVDRGEVDVALGDRTDTAVKDAQLHALVHLDLHEALLQRLDGTGNVTLDDEVEGLDLALLEGTSEVLEADALARLRQLGVALCRLALLSDLACGAVFLGDDERVSGSRHGRKTLHLNRTRRQSFLHRVAVLVL